MAPLSFSFNLLLCFPLSPSTPSSCLTPYVNDTVIVESLPVPSVNMLVLGKLVMTLALTLTFSRHLPATHCLEHPPPELSDGVK